MQSQMAMVMLEVVGTVKITFVWGKMIVIMVDDTVTDIVLKRNSVMLN